MSAETVPRRLVLVGSVVVDLSLPVPRLPDRGGDVLADGLSISAGGGMFVLRAAARGGLPAMYAGRHGGGPFGDIVRTALREAGVEAAYGPDDAGDTGPCVVLVEPDGERTMITANGVEAALDADRLADLDIRGDDAVYVSGYDLGYPVTGAAVAVWVSGLPAATVLVVDPGPLVAAVPAAVLDRVLIRTDVLTLSVSEAEIMCGTSDADVVQAELLQRLAPGAVVVLRASARGAALLEAGKPPVEIPVVPVVAADTTGAGDTHAGALLAARAAGLAWRDAIESANTDAANFLAGTA